MTRRLSAIVWWSLALACALSGRSIASDLAPGLGPAFAPGVPTIEALGEIPDSCDLVVSVENATAHRQSAPGQSLFALLRSLGFTRSLDESWPGLARELDLSSEQAFDALLGRRVILAVRSGDGDAPAEFAFLTEVDEPTEKRLRTMLRPAPRGLEIGFPILSIEGGRYEIASSEPRPAGDPDATATLVIAPAGAKLFDELVTAVQGKREGGKLHDTRAWKATRDLAGRATVLGIVSMGRSGPDERYAGFAGWPRSNGWRIEFAAGSPAIERAARAERGPGLPGWLIDARSPVFNDSLLSVAGSLAGVLPDDLALPKFQRQFLSRFLGDLAPRDEIGAPTAIAVYAESLAVKGAMPIEILMTFAAKDAHEASAVLDQEMAERVENAGVRAGSPDIRTGDLVRSESAPASPLTSVVSWMVRPGPDRLGHPAWCGVSLGHRQDSVPADPRRLREFTAAIKPSEPADDREMVFRMSANPGALLNAIPGTAEALAPLARIASMDVSAWLIRGDWPVIGGEIEFEFAPPPAESESK